MENHRQSTILEYHSIGRWRLKHTLKILDGVNAETEMGPPNGFTSWLFDDEEEDDYDFWCSDGMTIT
jgi:hypothetical protein